MSSTEVDSLELVIETEAKQANRSLTGMINRLNTIEKSLTRVMTIAQGGVSFKNLNIDKLFNGSSMQKAGKKAGQDLADSLIKNFNLNGAGSDVKKQVSSLAQSIANEMSKSFDSKGKFKMSDSMLSDMERLEKIISQNKNSAKETASAYELVTKGVSDMESRMREARQESNGLTGSIKELSDIGKSFSESFNTNIDTSGIKSVLNASGVKTAGKSAKNAVTPSVSIDDQLDAMYEKYSKVGTDFDASKVGNISKEIKSTEAELERLRNSLKKNLETRKSDELGQSFQRLIYDIQNATNKLEVLKEAKDKMSSLSDLKITRGEEGSPYSYYDKNETPAPTSASGGAGGSNWGYDQSAIQFMDEYANKTSKATAEASTFEAQIKNLKARLAELESQGYGQYDPEYDAVRLELERVTAAKKAYDKEMKSKAVEEAAAQSRSLKKSLESLSRISPKNLVNGLKGIAKSSKDANSQLSALKSPIKAIEKSLTGLKARFVNAAIRQTVFRIISGIRTGIVDGIKNLSQYSSSFNASMSGMVTSLLYLKNAFAVAFAPITSVVAPYISKFIDMIASALNMLGRFFAALTGKGYVVQAKKAWKDYASSVSSAGSSANKTADNIGKATDAAKEFQDYTLGIDELNVQPKQSSSSGGSGSGGSGGSGGGAGSSPAISDMFETVEVSGSMAELANMFKEAAKNSDFTEVGKVIGDKLSDVLESINWDSIYEKARNFGKGLATFLNGLISPRLFGDVGMTVANSLNTAIYAALSFGENFDFENLGSSIAEGINKFFENFDFGALAETLNVWVQGIYDSITTALSEVDWLDIYNDLTEFLENLDIETVAIIIGAITIKNIGQVILGEGLISWIGSAMGALITDVPIVIGNIKILAAGGLVETTGIISGLANSLALAAGGAATLHEALVATFGTVATTIAGVVAIIGGAILAVVNFFAMWKDGFSWLKEALMVIGIAIAAVGAVILGVPATVAAAVAAIVAIIATIAVVIHENWDAIKQWFSEVFSDMAGQWTQFKEDCAEVLNNIKEAVVSKFTEAYDGIKSAWAFVGTWAKEKYNAIISPFKNIKKSFSDAFQSAYNSVKQIWKGIGKYFKDIANDIISPIGKAVNGIISGVNWILSKVGSKTRLDKWSVPKFASGADGLPQDTVGMVNDQPGSTYREMIVPKNGKPFIPKGRNVVLPMEKGTKIMPADQTKALMQSVGVPHFAGGIGQFFSDAWESAKDIAGGIADYISHPDKLLQIALNKFVDISNLVSPISDIAGGVVKTTFNSIKDYIKGKLDAFVPKVTYSPSGGVEQWRAVATQALRITGQLSDANITALLNQMQHESGGNPSAINNWDINAKNGTPSKGLMQVIDPTFRAYALAPYNTNIYDPLSNMIAAIRYTVSRYGSLYNGWTKRGYIGYKTGIGAISLSDLPKYSVGGFPEDGLFMANRKELVGQFNGRNAVVNNYQIESGIEKAVYNGYMRAHAQDTREVSVLEEILTAVREGKTISIDGREIVRVYDSRKARNGYAFT